MAGGTGGFGTRLLDPRTWVRDKVLIAAFVVGVLLRAVPLAVFPQLECIRDECIYRSIAMDLVDKVDCPEDAPPGSCVTAATEMVDGEGMATAKKGWLPSPGYPYLLAWCKLLFGSFQAVKVVQVILSSFTIPIVYGIGREVGDRQVARIAAWLFAVNPTIAWFSNTMWIETIYIFFLLAAVLFMLSAVRSSRWQPAVGSGLAMGVAVLFRGVATYLPPFWILAALYPAEAPLSREAWVRSARERWRTVAAFGVALVLLVAPYSLHASRIQGGFMITDATMGHVLYLGNNEFPPLTFDYGNGMLTEPIFKRYLGMGRPPCNRTVPPVQSSNCEVRRAIQWASHNPTRFAGRIPVRLAQMFNPNSFLTRHLRWGYWPGFPWWAKEAVCVWIVATSAALTLLGTLGAWARARGPFAWMAVGTTVYTILTTAIMYGMTRFRLPLEALWTIYLAMFLASPAASFAALREEPWRLSGLLLTLPPLVALMLWYLPTGFPVFW
ncbi:MAG: glycosyltransferase family 39 protein [Myxococcota bacterium]